MGVTTKDLAHICGVSRTSVIRALNNQKGLSDETRQMILDKAKELEYRPDMLAKGLAQGKTRHIGVVVFDVKNQYFAQMLNAIENEAKKQNYFVNITLHEKDIKQEKELILRLLDYHVDGLLLAPVSKGEEFSNFVKSLHVPSVIIGNKVDDDITYIAIDEKQAAMEATSKIVARGYQRIVFVCPPLCDEGRENIYSHKQREMGYLEALKMFPDVKGVIIKSWDYIEEAKLIMRNSCTKTAFFCSGDIFALEIMKSFKKEKWYTPTNYGIMGFDNIELLSYIEPKLATIDNSVEEVGKRAVQLLFQKLQGDQVKVENIIEYTMVDGETLS